MSARRFPRDVPRCVQHAVLDYEEASKKREAQYLADIKALREQRDSVAAAAYAFVHATRERGAAMPKSMLHAWDRLLYTRDDLVRVALATFEWAGFKVDPEGAESKAANGIVDRLTKGDV